MPAGQGVSRQKRHRAHWWPAGSAFIIWRRIMVKLKQLPPPISSSRNISTYPRRAGERHNPELETDDQGDPDSPSPCASHRRNPWGDVAVCIREPIFDMIALRERLKLRRITEGN